MQTVGVEWDNRAGVHIKDFFQTANPDIYAIGDCATPYKFTHSADFQARLAVRNMFLGDTNKLSDLLIPWCTYTEPEVVPAAGPPYAFLHSLTHSCPSPSPLLPRPCRAHHW